MYAASLPFQGVLDLCARGNKKGGGRKVCYMMSNMFFFGGGGGGGRGRGEEIAFLQKFSLCVSPSSFLCTCSKFSGPRSSGRGNTRQI